jgi:lipopolysaccharide biosynthesis glycosyltransferase
MKKQKLLNIYIKWSQDSTLAADVCKYSIQEHASIPVNIIFLNQQELVEQGIYSRKSTEADASRFFIPYLNNYQDWAIYVDSNFVFVEDIAKLIENLDAGKAVHVVKHKYPNDPRKHWSSLMIWNCKHAEHQKLDLEYVNSENIKNLYNLNWIRDTKIGELEPEWNWIVNWYREIRDGYPSAIHYVDGVPGLNDSSEYTSVWHDCRSRLAHYKDDREYLGPKNLTLPDNIKIYHHDLLYGTLDPHQLIYDHDIKTAVDYFSHHKMPMCVGLMDLENEFGEIQVKEDHVVANFCIGAQGQIGTGKIISSLPVEVPAVIRGIAKKKLIHECINTRRDYYYIDTGYFGNDKRKHYHRVTKNNMQYLGKLDPNCSSDRFQRTGHSLKKFCPGKNILLCPPSEKAMSYWGLDLQEWLKITIDDIEKYTDRPIVIREKQPRRIRTNVDTIEMALANDVHCLVTFNSIAAVEALMNGKPVFTMGPNAAQPLANTDLSQIDSPQIPSLDEVHNLCCNLAYQQFTIKEMRDGTAWQMLNGL